MSVWPFVPQISIKERMVWMTEIIRCKGAEQRIRLRNLPRTELSFDYQLIPGEIEAATVLARELGSSEIDVPFWHELEYVGAIVAAQVTISVDTTVARYTVGGKLFIMGAEGFESHVIVSFTATEVTIAAPGAVLDFSNPVVMPLHPAYPKSPFKINKKAGDYVTANYEFISAADYEITGARPTRYATYDGKYVMVDRPVMTGSISETHTKEHATFDNIAGPIEYADTYNQAIAKTIMTWSFDTRAEVLDFRLWMYEVYGKQKSFLTPRWTRDFIPLADINNSASYLSVALNTTMIDTYIGPICIVMKDGTQYYEEVESWADAGDGTYEMHLVGTAPPGIQKLEDIEMVTRLINVRFNSDIVEFNYMAAGRVDVRLPLVEVPE